MRKKYLWQNSKGYWYVRIRGRLFPITAEEGSAEFDRQYWEIRSGKRTDAKRSWNALIDSYMRSDRWSNLKPRTRSDYQGVLIYLGERVGDKTFDALRRTDIIAAMEGNKHRIRFANYIPSVLSVLFEHAIDIGWTKENPAKGVRKLKMPKGKQQPHVPWTDDAVRLFRAEAAHQALVIFELGVGSVQRPGDWVGFTWGDFDGENLRLSQNKTNRSLTIPCTPELQGILLKEQARLTPHPSRHILTLQDGSPMPYRRMARIMHAERKRLGLERFDQHALRYRGIMELAWAGCTDEEIASYSGHTSIEMIRKYAGLARQIMRANSASEKRRLWSSM